VSRGDGSFGLAAVLLAQENEPNAIRSVSYSTVSPTVRYDMLGCCLSRFSFAFWSRLSAICF